MANTYFYFFETTVVERDYDEGGPSMGYAVYSNSKEFSKKELQSIYNSIRDKNNEIRISKSGRKYIRHKELSHQDVLKELLNDYGFKHVDMTLVIADSFIGTVNDNLTYCDML